MPIGQFNQEVGGLPESMEFETVGGLVLHELGELPQEGTGILIHDLEFTTVSVESNRIKTLAVKRSSPKTTIVRDTEEAAEEQQNPDETQGAEASPERREEG